jgi:hypothetical protein
VLPTPPTPPKFDDERPTQPDLTRFKCPGCLGTDGQPTGVIEEETWEAGHLHRLVRRQCDVCQGRRWVERDQLVKWAKRQPER